MLSSGLVTCPRFFHPAYVSRLHCPQQCTRLVKMKVSLSGCRTASSHSATASSLPGLHESGADHRLPRPAAPAERPPTAAATATAATAAAAATQPGAQDHHSPSQDPQPTTPAAAGTTSQPQDVPRLVFCFLVARRQQGALGSCGSLMLFSVLSP